MAFWAVAISSLCFLIAASGFDCETGECNTQYTAGHALLQLRKGNVRAIPGDSRTIFADGSLKYVVDVFVQTSSADFAGTETGALISFMVDGEWTVDVELVDRVPNGGLVNRTVQLPAWPSKLKISAQGEDSWSYESIDLHVGGYTVTVMDINTGYNTNASSVDSGEAGGASIVYTVSKLPVGFQIGTDDGADTVVVSNSTNCSTRYDEREKNWLGFGSVAASPGTPCIFGLDARDEGKHCIYDAGQYGELGWCYTDVEQTSWGACDENCPLWGQDKLLGQKIDEVLYILNNRENSSSLNTTVNKSSTVCHGCIGGCMIYGSCNTNGITTDAPVDEDNCVGHNGTWCPDDQAGAADGHSGSGNGSGSNGHKGHNGR